MNEIESQTSLTNRLLPDLDCLADTDCLIIGRGLVWLFD